MGMLKCESEVYDCYNELVETLKSIGYSFLENFSKDFSIVKMISSNGKTIVELGSDDTDDNIELFLKIIDFESGSETFNKKRVFIKIADNLYAGDNIWLDC